MSIAKLEDGSRIFFWKITNLSFCGRKPSECLESPRFRAVTDSSSWKLKLFSTTTVFEFNRCDLCRIGTSDSKELLLSSNLSIVCADGTLAFFQAKLNRTLSVNSNLSFESIYDGKIVSENKEYFMPNGELTLRCCVTEIQPVVITTINTHIAIERFVKPWNIYDFSKCILGFRMSLPMTVCILGNRKFWIAFYLKGNDLGSSYMEVNIFNISYNSVVFDCKISALNIEGSARHSKQIKHHFEKDVNNPPNLLNNVFKMPLMYRRDLIGNKDTYLINDVLALQCEFIVSTGNPESSSSEIQTVYAKVEKDKPINSLGNDMQLLFNGQKYCDVTFKLADGKCIKVIKAILSARSAVFNAMFENNMSEKSSGVVEVSDVDYDTLRRLLFFIYTDTLEDIYDHATAVKLYIAADKYQILSLKDQCSKYLATKIPSESICDVMYLASKYGDQNLKNAILKIGKHPINVVNSCRWDNWWKRFSFTDTQSVNSMSKSKVTETSNKKSS
ncbi:protein maternal effect lethal 26 [Nephila pilipes]|uniref:Protein maternal effect lethal 26 n=1 Tax=Nephila pilipes TaxID=299642 RepID=A0A8X6NY69_NEPPI|nr:protein maternal effect lethal 26 [Nephila pilipes]